MHFDLFMPGLLHYLIFTFMKREVKFTPIKHGMGTKQHSRPKTFAPYDIDIFVFLVGAEFMEFCFLIMHRFTIDCFT